MTSHPIARLALFGMLLCTLQPAVAAPSAGQMSGHAASGKSVDDKRGEAVFAVVGGSVITQQDYDEAFFMAARQKFYHGRPPESEVAALQREVGNNLVNRILLTAEARKRGIQPDPAAACKVIDNLEQRYAQSEQWQQQKAALIPEIKRRLEEDSLIRQLEQAVRNVPPPTTDMVQAYYERHPNKFTEPEQVKIGLILLRVDPSSPKAVWEKTEEEGKQIVRQLKAGGSFAEIAKSRSADSSAANGGDMGYLHRGMLPDAAQSAIDKLQPGEVSDPVFLLEGIAIFQLAERKPQRNLSFSEARDRATKLLSQELAEQAWKDLIEDLRKQTDIRVDESRYLPLKTVSGQAGGQR